MATEDLEVLCRLLVGSAPIIVIVGTIASQEAVKVAARLEVSESDREFIRSELGWLADWIKERYPEMTYGDIKRIIKDIIEVTI